MSHTIVGPAGLHDPVPSGYGHGAAIPAGAVASTDSAEQVRQAFRSLGVAPAARPGADTSQEGG